MVTGRQSHAGTVTRIRAKQEHFHVRAALLRFLELVFDLETSGGENGATGGREPRPVRVTGDQATGTGEDRYQETVFSRPSSNRTIGS